MTQNTMVNIGNNIWKSCVPWVNIGNNIWKKCTPWVNIGNNVWKSCYTNGYSLLIYIPVSGDSTSQSQSRVVTISNLLSVTSCTVNTGIVSYSVSETNVTINVNNGTPVRTISQVATDTRQTSTGGDPLSLPSSLTYNSGGYVGTLYGGSAYVLSGTYVTSDTIYVTEQLSSNYNSGGYIGTLTPYVYSGTASSSQLCTGYWGGFFSVVNGVASSSNPTPPSTIPYNTDGYVGNLNQIGVSAASQANFDAYVNAVFNDTSWNGYIQFEYNATLTKPDTRVYRYQGYVTRPESDTRIWKKDYSGTTYLYYYSYTVTLNYT